MSINEWLAAVVLPKTADVVIAGDLLISVQLYPKFKAYFVTVPIYQI